MTAFWQKLSQEYGLQYVDKRLFGWLNGFHVTLSTVLGTAFRFQVYLPTLSSTEQEMDQEALQKIALLRAEAVRALESAAKECKFARIGSFSGEKSVAIEFRIMGKAVKNMGQYITSAVSSIAALGIPTEKVCSHCGKPIEFGEVPVRIKDDVFPMHDNCADAATQQEAWGVEPKKGSLPAGILGAALAAIVGAIPWAAVYALGYVASITGILIGFLVSKGYDLLHGRQGRAKIAVVLLCVLLSVALGQIAGTSYDIANAYDKLVAGLTKYQTMTLTKMEFIFWSWENVILVEADALREVLSNFGLGVFFALLGCLGMFQQLIRDTAPKRPKRLTATM